MVIYCPVCGMAWEDDELEEAEAVWDDGSEEAEDDLWFCPACALRYETTGTFMPYSPPLDPELEAALAAARRAAPPEEEP